MSAVLDYSRTSASWLIRTPGWHVWPLPRPAEPGPLSELPCNASEGEVYKHVFGAIFLPNLELISFPNAPDAG